MASTLLLHKTNTHENQSLTAYPSHNYLFMIGATFAGVAFGVLMSLGLMRPMLHSEIASAAKEMGSTVAMQPANSFTTDPIVSCTEPTGTSPAAGQGSGAVLGAQTVTTSQPSTSAGGKGGGGNGGSGGGTKTVFVHKLVSGVWAKTNGTNRDTGADSTNVVKTTNTNTTTVTNHNDVTLTNDNPQAATSGDVTSKNNTHAGEATSGDAKNSSDTSFDVQIQN